MPKFKRPRLPKCPDIQQARQRFDDYHRIIRAARNKYRAAICTASAGLHGKALLRFLLAGARKMKGAGMYAESYLERDILWNLIRLLYRMEMGGARGSWTWWLADRGIPLPGVETYRTACA